MSVAESAIVFSDLEIRLGNRHLVRGLSGTIEPGEFLAVAGPSGSGKTTLLQVMAGFMEPSGGHIRFGEDNLFKPETVGFVYQHLRLARQLSALNAVCTGRLGRMGTLESAFGFSRSVEAGAYEELCQLGLKDHAYSPVGTLSGGERQRVAMARTLFQKPRIYFVDEPVANLDRANAQLVLSRLSRESREAGRTVVAVLHDDSQISLFADRVLRWDGKAESRWKMERLRDRRG